MSDTAKALIIKQAVQEGHTESYGVLVHLVAVMSADANALSPESEEEHTAWSNHFDGLMSALTCLTMHETKVGPESAAATVIERLRNAVDELYRHGSIGTGE